MVVFYAILGAPCKGYGERESLFRAHFARLPKVLVFCGTFVCTSKWYVERETSLASLEREGVAFSGLALLASQKWWFSVALLGAPVRGMQRGKLLLLCSRERGSLFRARFAHLSKVLVFCGTFGCTSKGYVERKTYLASLKRERAVFQGSLCLPLKSAGI